MPAARNLPVRAVAAAASVGILVLLATAALFLFYPHMHTSSHPGELALDSDAFNAAVFRTRTLILEGGLFLSALLLVPAISRLKPAKRGLPSLALACSCAFFAWFIFHFGNHQFGAWDFNIAIDTGWRQILGQRPYTGFITPNPPGFNLGIYYAFRIFGVTWNAQLFALILFCCVTFLWLYWLLRRSSASSVYALFLAFSVESITVLPLCFWWYNNVTSVLAAIYLLSAILYARQDAQSNTDSLEWLSYTISLSLLCLMKPNTAGLLIASITVLLLIAVNQRRRFLLATATGFALSLVILLLNHVSIPDLVHSYRDAAIERGGLNKFGLETYSQSEIHRLILWTLLLAAPLAALVPRLFTAARRGRGRDIASLLIFATALPVALYGMFTNGEIKELETSIIVVACGVLCLMFRNTWRSLQLVFVAMVASMVAAMIYYGVARERVRSISPGIYFEYSNADYPIQDNFFSSMRATPQFDKVLREMRLATQSFPGPVFLGPRLEYGYADLRIPSPLGWPVYYQPGTSFAQRDQAHLTSVWNALNFQTLIFTTDDDTYFDLYPEDLVRSIRDNYDLQPGFSNINVFRRHPVPALQVGHAPSLP
jgi:hypothetical protein